ncbi:MAG: hypothetical protein RQ731_03440 [Anaerosomatales bacterium]|nr:hypothetical protein [Anaerosomatales bacterium]MDT8433796.1 hypothetical protein [Anaerosomatales bacterium]
MTEKSHWPFSTDEEIRGARGRRRSRGESGNALHANQAMSRRLVRHDRLIVGGRAHAKKSGLS